MELTYQESAFILPFNSNLERNTLHKSVYQLVCNSLHQESRNFIFNAKLTSLLGGADHQELEYIITVRAPTLAEKLQPWTNKIMFTHGSRMSLSVQIPCYKRIRGKEKYIKEEYWKDWFIEYIQKFGFTDIILYNIQRVNEKVVNHKHNAKGGTHASFLIPTANFYFDAKVYDELKVSNAWINGIGRSKGFGFGLIEQILSE